MKIYHLLLAYYSALVSTGLFIWAAFFATTPERVTIAVLLLPISIYFWLVAAGAPKVDFSTEDDTSIGVRGLSKFIFPVLLSLLITAATLRLYMQRELTTETKVGSELSDELQGIQDDVSQLNALTVAVEKLTIKVDVLQDALNQAEVGGVTTESLDVEENAPRITQVIATRDAVIYQEPDRKSPHVGSVSADETYTLVDQEKTWYKISVDGVEGWVEKVGLEEL